jgi:hypothetical protein
LFGTVVTDTSSLWVKDTLVFRTGPASTSAEIYAWKNSTGSGIVYFEDAGLQIIEPSLISDDFEMDLAAWTITDNASLDPTAQSPFSDNGSDSQALRLFDDETTSTRIDRAIAIDVDDTLYIQFDYRHTAGIQNAGFQLWGGGVRGINLHLTGFGANDDAIQNRNATEFVTLVSGLLPDVWYRFNLTVEPASTGADSYALKVQSLESGTPFDFEVSGLPFQANLTVFDAIRFHFNISPDVIVGGEFFIDNLVVSSSASALFEDQDNDGILDSWELDTFGNLTTADATSDSDSDGRLDVSEFYFDTDPLGGFSYSGLNLVHASNNTSYISWVSSPDRWYRLFKSSDLANWDLHYTLRGTGGEIRIGVELPSPDPQNGGGGNPLPVFYRAQPVIFK